MGDHAAIVECGGVEHTGAHGAPSTWTVHAPQAAYAAELRAQESKVIPQQPE